MITGDKNEGTAYSLQAVVVHSGTSGRGHYVTYLNRKADHHWTLFDDHQVKEVSEGLVLRQEATILIYSRLREFRQDPEEATLPPGWRETPPGQSKAVIPSDAPVGNNLGTREASINKGPPRPHTEDLEAHVVIDVKKEGGVTPPTVQIGDIVVASGHHIEDPPRSPPENSEEPEAWDVEKEWMELDLSSDRVLEGSPSTGNLQKPQEQDDDDDDDVVFIQRIQRIQRKRKLY